jgi:glycosyltransferase involved in cell wall biosynthesis
MIVGIDGRSLAGVQARRGVAHYTASLAGALGAAFPDDSWRLLVLGGEPEASLPGVETVVRRLPRRAAFAAAALTGRPRLDRLLGGLDVAWAPAPAPLAVSRDAPLVLTLHDLSFADRPGDYTAYERAWHHLGRLDSLARRADRVMAVSQATRDAALARWDLDPERVAVVSSGVTRPATPPDPEEARRRLGLPERYLLFVGALEPRKAPDLLARAYARARRRGLDAALAVAGTGRLAGALDGPGVHRLGSRGRSDLDALYAGALALVMPSLAEGFGFPPLEAAACGTPSVVSDLAVFRETLGDDAALRVPAGDEGALAEALVRVATDDELRARLARAAATAIEGRTWEATARAAHAVLLEAAAR